MVYKSTELHLVQDDSEAFQETWLFLDRRLADVAAFGKFKTDVSVVGKSILWGLLHESTDPDQCGS